MRRLIVACVVAGCAALAAAGPAAAEPTWAPAASATVHPGVQTVTAGGQCTANFVFFDAADDVYLGQAAHCSSTSDNTTTNGCVAGTRPHGTPVEVDGASRPGTIVYSSWVTMQAAGETDTNACRFNDIALIKLDPADYGNVNPTIPFWGGPTGTATTTATGDKVLSYGNSSLRLGVTALSPKEGTSLGTAGGGWTHQVYTVSPGIPGDSGSAFIDRSGRAFGVLSTLQIAPLAGANGVSDLSRMLAYMASHGGPNVTLALGTEPFRGPLLP
ncbi:MAG TPA: serine protease [Solirubrobacteraceae bacterium]|nr:serine protease [Solirubrobacteraceae bacterium]